jgi:hypothetical protein
MGTFRDISVPGSAYHNRALHTTADFPQGPEAESLWLRPINLLSLGLWRGLPAPGAEARFSQEEEDGWR